MESQDEGKKEVFESHSYLFVFCVCVEVNFQELILSFHCIDGTQASRLGDKCPFHCIDGAQASRLGDKCLSLLSHLTRPGRRIFILREKPQLLCV